MCLIKGAFFGEKNFESLTIVCRSISTQTRNLSTLTVEHFRFANLRIAKAVTDASLFAMFICTMCKYASSRT
jgi:hypothetical protein